MKLTDNGLKDFILDIKKSIKISEYDTLKFTDDNVIFNASNVKIDKKINIEGPGIDIEVFFSDALMVYEYLVAGAEIFDYHDYIVIKYRSMKRTILKNSVGREQKQIDEVYDTAQVKASELLDALKKIKHSIAIKEIRYYLEGVFFQVQGDSMNVVSTTGHRLACEKIDLLNIVDIEESNDRVVYSDTIKYLIHSLTRECKIDKNAIISLKFFNGGVMIELTGHDVTSEFIRGSFPNYERVKNEIYDYEIKIEKKEVLDALKFLKPLTNKKVISENTVVISKEANKPLSISIRSEPETVINLRTSECLEKYKFTIMFQFHYFMDAVNSIDSDIIYANTSIDASALLHGLDKQSYRLVMPIFR